MDRKEVYINAEVLDELYSKVELVYSAQVTVPWKSKGKISHWKAIYIDPSAPTQQPGKSPIEIPYSGLFTAKPNICKPLVDSLANEIYTKNYVLFNS